MGVRHELEHPVSTRSPEPDVDPELELIAKARARGETPEQTLVTALGPTYTQRVDQLASDMAAAYNLDLDDARARVERSLGGRG